MESQEENRNLGGRPTLADDEVLAYRLVTRVNTKDNQAIQADFKLWKTGRAGRIADYLREIILNRKATNQQTIDGTNKQHIIEITQTLYNIRQHLKHIDTNYNQVTKHINSIEHTGKLYYEVQSSKVIIDKLNPLIDQIDIVLKAQTEAIFQK